MVRNQDGTGMCRISSGFPLPRGLVTEDMIREGKLKVVVAGKEVPANVTALRGRHHDGTLRSALIQFQYSMHKDQAIPAKIIIDGTSRSYPDPPYHRPTLETVMNNNVILPTDPNYISSTRIVFQYLLSAGEGTPEEEKQFTTLAADRFNALALNQNRGRSNYEDPKAMAGLWARTGDIKYFNEMLFHMTNYWAGYNFPNPDSNCKDAVVTNPDGVQWPNHANSGCWVSGREALGPRTQSYAIAYLLTGYRDFWGAVAAFAQRTLFQGAQIVDQQSSDLRLLYGHWDYPRFNYNRYAPLFSALMIDATIPVHTFWSGAKVNYVDHIRWALNSLITHQWDIAWVPFDNWDGNIPSHNLDGFTVTQEGVQAQCMALYFDMNAINRIDRSLTQSDQEPSSPANNHMWHRTSDGKLFRWSSDKSAWVDLGPFPYSGYMQIRRSSITGGNFSTGPLTGGLNADVSGTAKGDYRNKFVGLRSNGFNREIAIPVFQSIFPANFLIDYYLNIEADERIPELVYEITRIVLENIHELPPGHFRYQSGNSTWGYVTHGQPYAMSNPPASPGNHWELPEFARLIAFTLKTRGDVELNGMRLSEAYKTVINTANNSPSSNKGGLIWQWKHFGQYYGISQDAPWIMSRTTLADIGPAQARIPYQYDSIPGDIPDIARENDPRSNGEAPVIKRLRILK
ncbi:hypothetical protein [Desulfonatronum thiosulfatophilum]|uniref:hypothetical protein n=1 Tax=Desulfonatronum thiosulfatophilum TaxID=617002 RepID=UPI001113C03E|nr:hypothetical protein [Desulfonatronum thiosulfatophilum]